MPLLNEKFRPTKLTQVLGNKDAIHTINLMLSNNMLPHLIFTGPPGTGKTTCAKIIARTPSLNAHVLELNASDDRGIDVVRDKIKIFAHKRIEKGIKLIVLDEADSMTTAAQQALRRLMETVPDTRFILICNTFTKIFEPVQSRCAVLRFESISDEDIKKRLAEIADSESVLVEKDSLNLITTLSDGDFRQALNVLQSCMLMSNVSEETILKVLGQPSPKLIEEILDLLIVKKESEAVAIFERIWKDKFDPVDIVNSFFRIAKNRDSYEILKCIGPTNVRIVEGVNTKLQFYAMFSDILNI